MTLPFVLDDFLPFETPQLKLHSFEQNSEYSSSLRFLYEDGTDILYTFFLSINNTNKMSISVRYYDDERNELAAICEKQMKNMAKWISNHPSFRLYALYDDHFITLQNASRTLPIRIPYLPNLSQLETSIFLLDQLGYSTDKMQRFFSIKNRDFIERRLISAKDKLHRNPEIKEKLNDFLKKQLV